MVRTHDTIQTALEALRQIILAAETTAADIAIAERMRWQLQDMQSRYPASR